jgi:predicted acylesterase/phospholipase RssA
MNKRMGAKSPTRACLIAAFAFVATVPSVTAQEAVVLSSGGARGIAHVGALVGIERMGQDPDLVVGSSMGAIVGALYAAGYQPDTLWRMVKEMHWDDLFTPIPLTLGPDRVAGFSIFQLGLELGPFESSRGFAPDWRVNRLLVRLLFDADARSRSDFDRLARRYRAVAVDLANGKQVVLARGDLARAVRASMAAPGFFSPVLWQDGRLLADGGIASYLPVSVARGLGVARIIGVDVARVPPHIGRKDPVALGERAISILERNALADTIPPDVLIQPDIDPDLSAADFQDPTRLLQLGLDAALKTVPRTPMGRTARHSLPPAPDSLTALRIEVDDPALAALGRRIFRAAAPALYSPDKVLARVDRMYATGLVAGVWPRVVESTARRATDGVAQSAASDAAEKRTSGAVLIVRLDPIPRATLGGAAGYDNDRGGRIWGDLRRRSAFTGAPAEIGVSGFVNGLDRWVAASLRVTSIAWAPLAWSAGVYDSETHVRLFSADTSAGRQDVRRTGAWFGLEYPHVFPDWSVATLVRAERVDVERGDHGVSVGPLLRISAATPPPLVVVTPTELEAGVRFGDVAYKYFSFRTSRATALRKLLLAGMVDLAVTDSGAPSDVRRALGDARAMPGFRWGQERGQARVITGVDIAYPIAFQGFARLRLRAGAAPVELNDLNSHTWVSGAALEGIWRVPFGELLVGAGVNTRGASRFDVSLGPRF